jgi:iron complex transport system ATP-binding protein
MMGRNPHLGRFTAPSEHDQTVVSTALRRVGVAHLRNRVFTSLSGGERQRVLVARCLATEAPVLVLDEPTANLDIGHALALFDLLHELADDGATVVVAAHDLNLAMRYAGRCIVLDDGHVVADDDTLEALSSGVLQTVFRVDVTVLGTAGDRPVLAFSTRTPAVTEVYR